MGRKKDWENSFKNSGLYPFTWNFVLGKNEKSISCSFCGLYVDERYITKDHIYPKSLGGNIKIPSCFDCNRDKDSMKPIEFAIEWSKNGRAFTCLDKDNNAAVV